MTKGGGTSTNATEALMQLPMPYAGTIKNFCVNNHAAQPATGTEVITLRVNTANPTSGPVVTLPVSQVANGWTCDTTHTATVAAGDLVDASFLNNAGTTGASLWSITAEIAPATGGCTGANTGCVGIVGAVNNTTLTATNTFKSAPFAEGIGAAAAADQFYAPITRNGTTTIDRCYFWPSVASSGSNTVVATLMKNGAATSVTATINTGVTTVVSDTMNTATYVNGNSYFMQLVSTNATAGKINWACRVS